MKTGTRPKTVDEYLAALSDDKRAALEKLRKTIRSAAPKARFTSRATTPAKARSAFDRRSRCRSRLCGSS